MFKDDYKAAFSKVTASGDTYRRVMNMKKKTRSGMGVIGKVLIAAALISTLAVTVSAAELGWFRGYFEEKAEEPLSPAEIEFIEKNEQPIHETRTQDGYTLEVKSAITDGSVAYITIGVTGPEDAVLSKTVIEGYDPAAPSIQAGNWLDPGFFEPADGTLSYGSTIESWEDHDGRDNTQDVLLTIRPDDSTLSFTPGRVWKLHIQDLIAVYRNNAAITQQDTDSFQWNSEAAPRVVLAQGVWDFELDFGDSDIRSVELISEPVTVNASTDWLDGSWGFEDVRITSFTLSSLGGLVRTDGDAPLLDLALAENGNGLWAVLKDGSQIELRTKAYVSINPGEQPLEALRPIPLDQVDHVLLADGTRLPMP